MAVVVAGIVRGQDGVAGIQKANEMVRNYFSYGVDLLYGIGALFGIIGAVRVYRHWVKGDREAEAHATSWFTACIFLVVVATVLRSFFGV